MAQQELIVAAPTAFKETLTPSEAAEAIAQGVRRVVPKARLLLIPVADGGDGTVDAITSGRAHRVVTVRVFGPLLKPVRASFALLGREAILEMSSANGLRLVPAERRNPEAATTWGTGELIAAAWKRGARRILLGVGGSATVDGGSGAIGALIKIFGRKAAPVVRATTVLCDVTTPYVDAPRIFGPQKGATPSAVTRLELRLETWARFLESATGRDIRKIRGGGAAGGLAAGLAAFGARLVPGAHFVLKTVRFRERARGALVLTGEGSFDRTSLAGKAVGAVLACSPRAVVLCGRSALRGYRTIELSRLAGSTAEAMRRPAFWLSRAAEAAVSERR